MPAAWRIKQAILAVFLATFVGGISSGTPARAEAAAFAWQSAYGYALWDAARFDLALAEFYRERGFEPIWITVDGKPSERLDVLYRAIAAADTHGLDPNAVGLAELEAIRFDGSARQLAEAEASVSGVYLKFAQIIHAGLVDPSKTSEFIHLRKRHRIPTGYLMAGVSGGNAAEFVEKLAPQHFQYAELRKELLRLRRVKEAGGWGPPAPTVSYSFGMRGPHVLALRDRLVRKGYHKPEFTGVYSMSMANAVRRLQQDYGLDETGIANWRTLEALNSTVDDQIRQVEVGLERLRWLSQSFGPRYVMVNIPEYRARMFDGGQAVFESTVIVGQAEETHQTPEFSEEIEYLVVNPIWYVPESIVVDEVIPAMMEDIEAEPDLVFVDTEEMTLIDRRSISFVDPGLTEKFPYKVVQPPGATNPLGSVKFMFPNRYNIYLHDTPFRDLFGLENRAHSHGCVRVEKSHDLARMLLGEVGADFDELRSGVEGTFSEETISLHTPIPVHITYRTVWAGTDGRIHYRRDIYGRDKSVHDALLGKVLSSS
ncbi:MAG: L,D-transpeptidase family protein [Rhodobacteraceae bacterium]|nr:L,D-transpeptidase family protein [Paracoccaceae bacterium]